MTIFDPIRPRPERLPTPSFADAMLMDVARRVQLSPTKHDEAQQHFEALCSYVDRPGSPLQDKVIACYPGGSFATGTAISQAWILFFDQLQYIQDHEIAVFRNLNLIVLHPRFFVCFWVIAINTDLHGSISFLADQ